MSGPTRNFIAHAERLADRRNRVPQRPFNPDDHTDQWLQSAACTNTDPDLFTSTDQGDIAKALTYCDSCPVLAACRNRRYDLGAIGVWGGVHYPAGARTVRPCARKGCQDAAQSPQRPYCGFEHEHAAKVGTRRGYELHKREGQDACTPCKEGRYAEKLKYNASGRKPGVAARPRGVRKTASVAG